LAGAGFADVRVAPFQGDEHGLDVRGVQGLDRNVAQVRDQVEADVVVVAAYGLFGQAPPPGQPPGQILRGGGGDGGRYPGADTAGDGVRVGQRRAGGAVQQQVGDLQAQVRVVAGQVEQGPGLVAFGDRVVAAIEAAGA